MTGEHVSYEEFGALFVPAAVTVERIAAAIASIAEGGIILGPFNAGPGGAASVKVSGTIGAAAVRRTGDRPLTFSATMTIRLDLSVRLGGRTDVFHADVEVPLRLAVRTARPLMLIIDVADVAPADLGVRIEAAGLRQRVLRAAGDMDGEIRRRVVDEVHRRVDSEHSLAVRHIDITPLIDRAWRLD